MSTPRFLCALSFSAFAVACGSNDSPGNPGGDAALGDAGMESDATVSPDASAQACVHDVRCIGHSITELNLFEPPAATGLIAEEGTTPGEFLSYVNATADVMRGQTTPRAAYVYARFTETGLEQVGIGDEDAFESTEWDIAFRRYIVRLNSGVSGPSCVRGVRLPPAGGSDPAFESVTELPSGLDLHDETYVTENEEEGRCEIESDSTGFGTPSTLLVGYHNYISSTHCVSVQPVIYVLQLADGRRVKLQVRSYYENPEHTCDASMSAMSASGHFRIRWAFLD